MTWIAMAVAATTAMGLSWFGIRLTMPLLRRYALARPSARSSHVVPTPQGAGAAVIAATLLVSLVALGQAGLAREGLPGLTAGVLLLVVVGAVDDIRPLAVLPRLTLHVAAVLAIVMTTADRPGWLPGSWPPAIESALLVVAGVWFVNLVNFMDGLDWLTVTEMVPLTAMVALFAAAGIVDAAGGLVAAAACGALLGFAPSNKPPARVFLGDVGSLPIGLIGFWLLLQLALQGAWAAALLLPLYYVVDATLTLALRVGRRERFWEPHRSHFYQRATANGWSVSAVVGRVAALNGSLTLLALSAVVADDPRLGLALLAVGGVAVAWTLRAFARPPAGAAA
ncbi:MAG: glycosyl transferase [Pseudomonadota bacterium]